MKLPWGSRITFEPGGQIELSSATFDHCNDVIDALCADALVLGRKLAEHDIELTAGGVDPMRTRVLRTSEARYVAMREFFDGYNSAGGHMMCTTAAVHVNIGAGLDDIGRRRWRAAHLLGPTLVAMFANSPIVGGKPTGWMSSRMGIWLAIDPCRSTPVYRPGADPAESWAEYALDAKVMFVRGPAGSSEASPSEQRFLVADRRMSMQQWIENGHEHGFPTVDDVDYHLTTLFPPVRPRGWIELRMIDMLADPWWQVAAALTWSLLADEDALEAVEEACTPADGLWTEAAVGGLRHPALRASSLQCFFAGLDAMHRLGIERSTINAAQRFAERFTLQGRCPADELVDGKMPIPISSSEGVASLHPVDIAEAI